MSIPQLDDPSETVSVVGALPKELEHVLSKPLLCFLAELHLRFESIRQELLQLRKDRQVALDRGDDPGFLPETEWIRTSDWKGPANIPDDLKDRRVEITGPVDRKMIINALNSGAKVFMADFEDSSSPTFENMVDGQQNLYDAVRRTIEFQSPEGKSYKLKAKGLATLMVRPRGWHLEEHHILIGGRPMSGSLFDFGVFFFNNAKYLVEQGSGPYFYLPKMESHLEARLWNDVFEFSQSYVGLPVGTVRATVLIETILAAFEMDEIIYELRRHSAGLNCGRWDYIFSFIKKFKNNSSRVLPDRDDVGMTKPFMDAYVRLLIKTCHRRGVHAMGGMAAQIPIKNDAKANKIAMDKVAADKKREVLAGHDGTWVAHPALIPIAQKVFDQHMKGQNQLHVLRNDVNVKSSDLLNTGGKGQITEQGLRVNIDVGLRYTEAWLRGVGCVPIHNKMEDAATAEISRSQIWHWLRHNCSLSNGKPITKALVRTILEEETTRAKVELGDKYSSSKFDLAKKIYADLMLGDELADFLTLAAYPHIVKLKQLRSSL
eukprot:TRINITY_DN1446_c0_g1_i1.p1 TRINITY_DN1446_c0_g1~~TRINITY_DN1446_c0_g1_i1.p1  ORF type:complete len:546 (+),score=158.99 TRINITY_DN1446_c0_g1_i1:163-1800(+)